MRFAALVCLLTIFPLQAQERPLPEVRQFLAKARERLQTDEQRQSHYAYVETRRERRLDKDGRTTRETIKVFESYPALPGEGRWNRLIAVDGKPLPPEELAKQDRERQKKVQAYLRKERSKTDADRAKEARERDKKRREETAAIDDAFRILDIRMLGRETIEGHGTIVFSLNPRPDVKPRTDEGRLVQHFAGKAWVSESEYELVRLDVEALETVNFGLGLLARIHQGSRGSFQRRKVNGEEWLPARATYMASARVMLFRVLRVGGSSEFSQYRKFNVTTDATYAPPK